MPVLSLGWEDPLEDGMATHSSIPVWRIPRTEEPGRLQSIALQSQTQLKRPGTHIHNLQPQGQSHSLRPVGIVAVYIMSTAWASRANFFHLVGFQYA